MTEDTNTARITHNAVNFEKKTVTDQNEIEEKIQQKEENGK